MKNIKKFLTFSTVPKIEGMLPPVVNVEFYADKEDKLPTKEYVTKN